MSKGSNSSTTDSSTTSTVAPTAQAMQTYQDLLTRLQGVSSTPYQAFGGQEIAPINATQQAGIGHISGMADAFQPYGQQAGENIAQGTGAVTADDISRYYDPYTQQVIDSTMADFDTMNKRANSITTGNAAAQGALGGNRVGVAQALTQEGQTRAQAPVIAGLRSAGFQSAEQMANAQKMRQLQGGQAELSGGQQLAQAQVGAGTLEQQTTQAQDTQARADYFQAQGYPFATAQWLAAQATGVGGAMGSTTSGSGSKTTQGPQPNQWLQAAGLGLSAAAMFARDGGRIAGFAEGGAPGMDVTGGFGWVPTVQMQPQPLQAHEMKPPEHDRLPEQKDQMPGIGKSLGAVGGGLYNKFADSDPNDLAGTADSPLPGLSAEDYGGLNSYNDQWQRGGRVPRRGFADGGVPVSAGFGGGAYDDDLSPNDAVEERFANPLLGSDQYRNIGEHTAALKAEGMQRLPGVAVAENEPLTARPVQTTSYKPPTAAPGIVAQAKQAFDKVMPPNNVEPSRALGFSEDTRPTDVSSAGRARPVVPGVSAAPPATPAEPTEKNMFGLPKLPDEARQGLISMGLGMMSNRIGGKGSFLAGVGEGGQQGVSTYASARAATLAQEAQARKERFEREKFDRPYREMTAQQKAEAGLKPWRIGKDGNLEATPGGPHDPKTIRTEAEAKLPPSLMTPQSLDTAADTFRMTGKLPPNMGRGTQGAMEATMIRNRAAEREQDAGGDPSDWANRWQQFGTRAAGMRTLENRAAGLTLAENEARALVPRVRELISKVDRTRFPDLNSLLIAARNKTGSEQEIKLGIAIGSLIPVYARVMKPVGQVGQTDMANAQHLLEQKWSAGQLNAALDQFEIELHTAKEALAQARKEYGESGPALSKKDTPPPAAGAGAPASTEKKIARQGKVNSGPNAGKTVIEYTDGTREYK